MPAVVCQHCGDEESPSCGIIAGVCVTCGKRIHECQAWYWPPGDTYPAKQGQHVACYLVRAGILEVKDLRGATGCPICGRMEAHEHKTASCPICGRTDEHKHVLPPPAAGQN